MNFLVCDVPWSLDANGYPFCSSGFRTATTQEVRAEVSDALTWEEVADYQAEIISLFAVVFGFLALRKLLQ